MPKQGCATIDRTFYRHFSSSWLNWWIIVHRQTDWVLRLGL